jgi:hypothetical protein
LSDPDAPPLDPEKILAVLERHQVDYVLVGGLASEAHGSTRQTKDLDLCPAWTPENLTRVAAVLNDLGAGLKIGEGSIDLLRLTIDGKMLAKMEIGTWRTVAGDIDVLLGIPSTGRWDLVRYDQLIENASVIELEGQRVLVAALEDIIRSKEIADRPADREALPELQALLDRRRELDPPDLGPEL